MNNKDLEFSKKDAEGICIEVSETEEFSVADVSEEEVVPIVKKRNVIVPIIAFLLVGLIAVSGVFFVLPLFSASEYEEVAKEYAAAMARGDVRSIGDVSVCDLRAFYEAQLESDSGGDEAKKEQFFKEASNYYGKEIEDLDGYIDAAIDENEKGISEYYGKYKVITEVLSVKELEEKTLVSLKDAIDEEKKGTEKGPSVYFDVDTSKITEGCIVEVEVTIKGEKNKSTNTIKCTTVKYDEKWKVIPGV